MDWLKTVDEIDDIVHEGRSSGVGKSYVEAEIYAAAVEQLRAEARDLIEFERTQREPVVTSLVDELARIGAEGRSVPFTGRRRIDGAPPTRSSVRSARTWSRLNCSGGAPWWKPDRTAST